MQELKELGLTDNEIKIYLALLELGTSTPSQISSKLGLSRSYVYDALDRLLEKEIVSTILVRNKKNFSANNPKRILESQKQKLENLRKIIPNLERLGSSRENIKVELHKGTYIYKILLNDITSLLKRGEEVLIFGIDDEFLMKNNPYYEIHLEQYYKKLRNLNLKERCIVKSNAKIIEGWEKTEYKFISEEIIGNTAFEVYANKVAIFLWGSPNYLILIESKEAANSYRKQFEIMWKIANK